MLNIDANDLSQEPIERASTLPASLYVEPAVLEWERQHLFPRTWQWVGAVHQWQKENEYKLCDVAGRSVLVSRQADGFRAFHNVCRHRGGPLAYADGCSKTFQCKYHGWTYDLSGQLKNANEMNGAQNFDAEDFRLKALDVALWDGQIFVAIQPAFAHAELVAGISQRIQPLQLADLSFHRRVVYPIACNWKVYVDNYLEGYHLPYVHPGLSKVLDYRVYRTELGGYHSLQCSPIDGSSGPYAAGEAFYYFLYPNMMLNILPNRLQVNLVEPTGPQSCRVLFDYFYGDPAKPEVQKLMEEDESFSDEVQDEDIRICEWVQRGLASGSYERGRYSPIRETGLHHFHQHLRQAYAHG
ncbi:MAG: Rieske 2Fe-2S domain-containing protein [Acidobacteria bacterium]|nr:Rieske 2Fe-2S domain-containing protein [Acidobacteriota bacterium]MCB9397460.1 Rieske 2Fe-2S domain-containing protein [Acidobacteriota bacterium]